MVNTVSLSKKSDSTGQSMLQDVAPVTGLVNVVEKRITGVIIKIERLHVQQTTILHMKIFTELKILFDRVENIRFGGVGLNTS